MTFGSRHKREVKYCKAAADVEVWIQIASFVFGFITNQSLVLKFQHLQTLKQLKLTSDGPYLLIEHVGVFCEPDTQAVESSDDHGVQISGVKRSRTTALIHDITADGADGTLTIRRLHAHLHLDRQNKHAFYSVCTLQKDGKVLQKWNNYYFFEVSCSPRLHLQYLINKCSKIVKYY